jgi:hypothetical protein
LKELISALAPTASGETTLLYFAHHAKPTKQESAFILARNDGRSSLSVGAKHNGFCFPPTASSHGLWRAANAQFRHRPRETSALAAPSITRGSPNSYSDMKPSASPLAQVDPIAAGYTITTFACPARPFPALTR